MATAMKTKKNSAAEVKTDIEKNTTETSTVENITPKKKEFAPTDGVLCRSITPGQLFMEGLKSRILYTWLDNGDVVEVEYQDVVAAIRANRGYVTLPLFVIEDKDVIAEYPQLNKIYDALYTYKDLRDVILDLNPADMKATIMKLPEGAKNSIKHIASQLISDGTLDSVKKIKTLDEIFDTELSIMTGLFNG